MDRLQQCSGNCLSWIGELESPILRILAACFFSMMISDFVQNGLLFDAQSCTTRITILIYVAEINWIQGKSDFWTIIPFNVETSSDVVHVSTHSGCLCCQTYWNWAKVVLDGRKARNKRKWSRKLILFHRT